MSVNLPLLTSALSIACIITVGRHKWWGHLFGVANCIAFTIIALHGQWGYLPSNIVCFVLYANNAREWKRNGNLGKMAPTEAPYVRKWVARQEQHLLDAKEGRFVLAEGGLQEPSYGGEVSFTPYRKMGQELRRVPMLVLQRMAHRGSGKSYIN